MSYVPGQGRSSRKGTGAGMNGAPVEARATRLKRLAMRSWRRGTKEMDLVLGRFADAGLDGLSDGDLDLYDALLAENDHDLYRWVTGAEPPPAPHAPLIARLRAFLAAGSR